MSYTTLELKQQAALEGVTLAAIRVRVARTGKLERTAEPEKAEDGKYYYTSAQIKQKALEDGVTITTIKRRIRQHGSMSARVPVVEDKGLIEYIAARDGVSIETIHRRIRRYGDPETTHNRGPTPSPEVFADAEFMMGQGVPVEIIALKYSYTTRQMAAWLRIELGKPKYVELSKAAKKPKPKTPKPKSKRKKGSGRPKGAKDKVPRKKRGDHPGEALRKEKISMKKQHNNWLRGCEDKRFARRLARKKAKKERKLLEKFQPKDITK